MIVLANPPSKKHGIPNFQFSKRVKFTMKRQKVKRLLVELDTKKNDELSVLVFNTMVKVLEF